jgi:hypothetical protein
MQAAPSKEIARQLFNDMREAHASCTTRHPQHSRYEPPTVWGAWRRLIDGPVAKLKPRNFPLARHGDRTLRFVEKP